jgi:hypothetical protein
MPLGAVINIAIDTPPIAAGSSLGIMVQKQKLTGGSSDPETITSANEY